MERGELAEEHSSRVGEAPDTAWLHRGGGKAGLSLGEEGLQSVEEVKKLLEP